jgi:hypothetical protein
MVQVAFPSASVQEGATLTAVDGLIIFPAGNDCSYRRIGSFHGADEKEFEDCPRWIDGHLLKSPSVRAL